MLQNTPTKAEIRQQIKFNDRLFLKNQTNAGIKDFFKKIGKGAKKIWNKIKKPVTKVWDFVTTGPGNALLNLIPKVGPILAPSLKTADDVIDTGIQIAKDIKKTKDTVQHNLNDPNAKLLDDVDTEKLKQDYDWVKNKTIDVYNMVKDKLSTKQKASAIQAAGMINLELLKTMKPLQRGRMKKILPYVPYIDINKHSRVTIPKIIRDLDKDAPKTIDNTGGRLFLKGYSSGINLNDVESGRISLSGNLSLTEPQSGRITSGACSIPNTVQKKSDKITSGTLSKEEIYKKLFG